MSTRAIPQDNMVFKDSYNNPHINQKAVLAKYKIQLLIAPKSESRASNNSL